jgi:hypothetical protein
MLSLRVLHLLTSTLLCTIYFRVKAPLAVSYMRLDDEVEERKQARLERKQEQTDSFDAGPAEEDGGEAGSSGGRASSSPWLDFTDTGDSKLDPPQSEFEMGAFFSAVLWVKDLLLNNVLPYYYTLYWGASAWGLWDGNFNNEAKPACAEGNCMPTMGVFIYAAHLLDVFNLPVGQLVMQSLLSGGPGLLSSGFITLIATVLFGTAAFVFYDYAVYKCDTYFQVRVILLG